MKICELTEPRNTVGIFVGVELTPNSLNQLLQWINENNITGNITPTDQFHTTLIQDKEKSFPWKAQTYNPPLKLELNTYYLDLFGLSKDILVLGFECEFLQKKHQLAKQLYNIKWDFDNYDPHITLARNVVNFDVQNIALPKFPIFLNGEYVEAYSPNV
jgi:2'-5' RNA ligase